MKDELGSRMKENYEKRGRHYLTRRTPVILRLDGKAFHTFTKEFKYPFDSDLSFMMTQTAKYLCKNVQGAKMAYVQSDEISILITDYDNFKTDAWFNYETSKMNSVASSMCTAQFNHERLKIRLQGKGLTLGKSMDDEFGKSANFDCRAFNIPPNEVPNYFRWRFMDWRRNSISMLANSLFSAKQLHKKNQKDMYDMCLEKGTNWDELNPLWKNGTLIHKDWYGNWSMETDLEWIMENSFLTKCHLITKEKD